ncbi:MAG: galactokinase [Bacteroidota bacterium]
MNQVTDIIDFFGQHYKTPNLIVRAPARINLIGEHTDYNEGFVMPAAIDRTIYFAMGWRAEHSWQLHALDISKSILLKLEEPSLPSEHWAKYFYAILLELRARGWEPKGVHCVFGGDIPSGAGISSSAALTCGFIYALDQLHQWSLDGVEIAKIAQAAEHRVGLNCGIMDQYAVLHGKQGKAIQLDCRSLTHQYAPVEIGDFRFVLFNSMVSHSLADTEYNKRRAACEAVVSFIQQHKPDVQTVRDLNASLLAAYEDQLEPLNVRRVRFVLSENERVLKAAAVLQQGDLKTFGQLMFQSHDGLSKVYEVSCEELDFLVDFVRPFSEQVLGARMMGGGFGGCTLNLIHKDAIDLVYEQLAPAFEAVYGLRPDRHIVQLRDGVSLYPLNVNP